MLRIIRRHFSASSSFPSTPFQYNESNFRILPRARRVTPWLLLSLKLDWDDGGNESRAWLGPLFPSQGTAWSVQTHPLKFWLFDYGANILLQNISVLLPLRQPGFKKKKGKKKMHHIILWLNEWSWNKEFFILMMIKNQYAHLKCLSQGYGLKSNTFNSVLDLLLDSLHWWCLA